MMASVGSRTSEQDQRAFAGQEVKDPRAKRLSLRSRARTRRRRKYGTIARCLRRQTALREHELDRDALY